MKKLKADNKAIFSWCLYDWSLSSFSVVMTTFVFSSYFTSKIAANEIIGTEQWANAVALSGILIAILSPILGSIADYSGKRKYWLGVCTFVVVISSALFWFSYPRVSSVYFVLFCLVLGSIGLNIAYVFYNAMLLNLTSVERMGLVSGWGWGMGYFGGLVVLIIAFYSFVNLEPSWLNVTTYEHVRICGPLVAIWIVTFSWPIFMFVPETLVKSTKPALTFKQGMQNFSSSIPRLLREKNMCTFLVAQMIYIDGLNTLFAFGGIYAAGTFHMNMSEVLLLGIVLNACAGFGSTVMSWIDDWIGSKLTILLSLVALTLFGFCIVFAENKTQFWVFASLLSLFVGSVQSSSRSLMAQLAPKENAASMFGFYVLSGKISTFVGPLVLGYMTMQFNSQRIGMATLLIFFVIGAGILVAVRTKENLKVAE